MKVKGVRRAVGMMVVVLLGSCDGGPRYPDAIAALEAGDRARAAKSEQEAESAYLFAAANAGERIEVKHRALMGLGEVKASKSGRTKAREDIEAAIATFSRAESECAAAHDIYGAQRIIDAWIRAQNPPLAGEALKKAEARFPQEASKLDKQRTAVKLLESGDVAGLKNLGYVGD